MAQLHIIMLYRHPP